MPLAICSGQSRHPDPVQIEQPYVAIVMRYRYYAIPRYGQPIDGRIRPDSGQRRPHITQVPHLDRAIIRSGDHFIVAREHGRGHGSVWERNRGKRVSRILSLNTMYYVCKFNSLRMPLEYGHGRNLIPKVPQTKRAVARRRHYQALGRMGGCMGQLSIVSS